MLESERKQLNELNRELMVEEAECVELLAKVRRTKKGFSELKKQIKNLRNRKEESDGD